MALLRQSRNKHVLAESLAQRPRAGISTSLESRSIASSERPALAGQRNVQALATHSNRVLPLVQLQKLCANSERQNIQRAKFNQSESLTQLQQHSQSKSQPGLPGNLKMGIEALSGQSLDNVTVNFNSSKPKALNAHAYAQGQTIEIGPGQERHLPHEAWHVAQQLQGRVRATQHDMGVPINDDKSLEHEADVMGKKALQFVAKSDQNSHVE